MLSSAAAQSSIFRRLTNREQPRLAHPTATAFAPDAWQDIVDQGNLTDRDMSLALSAFILGMNLKVLRERYIDSTFKDLSGSELATFAVADTNRAWAILWERTFSTLAEVQPDVLYAATAGKVPFELGENSGPAGIEDLNTSFVDTLPHWFARAATAPVEPSGAHFNYNQLGRPAQGSLSLEHALKEVWQEVLWESWSIDKVNGGWAVRPKNSEDQALWRIWEWREQSLLLQAPLLNRQFDRLMSGETRPDILARTVVGVRQEPNGTKFVLGTPEKAQIFSHRTAIEMIENSYLGPFIDQPLAGSTELITPRMLELTICVLQDASGFLLPKGSDVEYHTFVDIERLSCSIRREEAVAFISEALEIDTKIASVCISRLTSSPFDDVRPLFANGLWHRPLVANRDGTMLMIVMGALNWGSPRRRVERWVQEGSRGDFSKTSIGLRYEAHLRELFQEALSENDIIKDVAYPVCHIPNNNSGEEIDCLIRIGETVLVLEIKCLLSPSDPIERYDYVRKLEEACSQATRKASWLQDNWADTSPLTPLGNTGKTPRIVPLVVVNQSNGTSCKFGDCVVIDAHFFELFLGSGSYHSGGMFEAGDDGRMAFAVQNLYDDAAGAEACIPDLFASHPGLTVFRKAVRWEIARIPLMSGDHVLMSFATMDAASYAAAMPDPENLMPGSTARRDQ